MLMCFILCACLLLSTAPTPIKKDYLKANGGPFKGFDLNYVMPDPAGSLEPVWWKPGQNPQVCGVVVEP